MSELVHITTTLPSLQKKAGDVLGGIMNPGSGREVILDVKTHAPGPQGSLPFNEQQWKEWPSGHLFGASLNVAMGADPKTQNDPEFLILSTQGGLRAPDGKPIALGYHTGHWELGLLVEAAAKEFTALGTTAFSGTVSDPCDGRSQGTTAMMDSLPYRNDAATVLGRLRRSLPKRVGVLGIATCDKGLPAMMMSLANEHDKPTVIVPGGVTLASDDPKAEDTGKIQSAGARVAAGEKTVESANHDGCAACASPGGGCQFLGTAATSQVVAEALGMALPHSALMPSGQPIWIDMAQQSARALASLAAQKITTKDILTDDAIHNAMVVHAAFGGSTNLLLHIPAIAHAAGLKRPTREDWEKVNRETPRLVDVLPNNPDYKTIHAFMAGGVPEVMLHLRDLGLLKLNVMTVTGKTLGENLQAWEKSERREKLRAALKEKDHIDPDKVIYPSKEAAQAAGLTSTVTFPSGNIAPEGSVIKSTAIDPSVVGKDPYDPTKPGKEGVYHKIGPARVFTSEKSAMEGIKAHQVQPGDVIVLIGSGPSGTGMEETYQITSALKYMKGGKNIALITDGRFSGVSTGACIGHIGPEALDGGPIGRIKDGDFIEIIVDRNEIEADRNMPKGRINLIGEKDTPLEKRSSEKGSDILKQRLQTERNLRRPTHPDLKPNPELPDATKLWAALQRAGGGHWGGCVYDVDAIARRMELGEAQERIEKAGTVRNRAQTL